MAKELPYFRFTPQEWQNGNISMLSDTHKGLFIDICCWYWIKDCSITQAMLKLRFKQNENLLKQLFEYGIITTNDNDEFIAIKFLDEQFDQLSTIRKLRQDAGCKGGKQRASNAKAKVKQMLKQKSSYKDKDKDKDIKKEEILKKKEKTQLNKIPPLLEDVKAYCKERGKGVDPEKWYNHYEAKGWMIGKNKMKDWRAAVRTWEDSNGDDSSKKAVVISPEEVLSGRYR